MKNSVLFMNMSNHEYVQCFKALKATEKTYKKDALILTASDTTKRFGLVLDGSVTIESNDIWGNRTILSHVAKRQFFAETYALLDDEVLLVSGFLIVLLGSINTTLNEYLNHLISLSSFNK